MSSAAVDIPGLVAGTWSIDPVHSEVGFTVRHLMVSKVKGTFKTFTGTISIAPNPLDSKVEANIETFSVDTRDENRDNHLRSSDFFEVEKYPYMTFVSTAVRPKGHDYVVTGDLSIRGVTRQVELESGVQWHQPRSVGRHPGRLLGYHRDQPGRLRNQFQHAHRRRRRRGGRQDQDQPRGRSGPAGRLIWTGAGILDPGASVIRPSTRLPEGPVSDGLGSVAVVACPRSQPPGVGTFALPQEPHVRG